MRELFINKISKPNQLLISVSVVGVISALCFSISSYLDYKIVAFILLGVVLLTVSFMYQRLKKLIIDDAAKK